MQVETNADQEIVAPITVAAWLQIRGKKNRNLVKDSGPIWTSRDANLVVGATEWCIAAPVLRSVVEGALEVTVKVTVAPCPLAKTRTHLVLLQCSAQLLRSAVQDHVGRITECDTGLGDLRFISGLENGDPTHFDRQIVH